MSKKSASKSAETFRIKLGASPALLTAFVLLHIGALVLLYPIDLPWASRAVLAIVLGASLYRTITQHALRSALSAVILLRWSDRDGLEVGLRGDESLRAAVIRSRFVHRWLVLLSVQVGGKRLARPLTIAVDALDAESFRRLRAALLARPRTSTV